MTMLFEQFVWSAIGMLIASGYPGATLDKML